MYRYLQTLPIVSHKRGKQARGVVVVLTVAMLYVLFVLSYNTDVDMQEPVTTKRLQHHDVNLHSDTETSLNSHNNNYNRSSAARDTKMILLWTTLYGKPWMHATSTSPRYVSCPSCSCHVTADRSHINSSDAVIFYARDLKNRALLPAYRRHEQIWVFHTLESPYNLEVNLSRFNGVFNMTSTYSYDSDIPRPYGRRVSLSHTNGTIAYPRATKSRMAAWFVSNCKTPNNRSAWVDELSKYVQVDIYGNCGPRRCDDVNQCLEMLSRNYRFYLALENSNCRDYITEKFWWNALSHDIVPVVMGARRSDYERLAPPGSFIHADDFSSLPELARYLKLLSTSKKRYNSYFNWKKRYKIHVEEMRGVNDGAFWCDVCSAISNTNVRTYPRAHQHLDTWWSTHAQCSHTSGGEEREHRGTLFS